MNLSNLAIAVPVYLPSKDSPRVEYFRQHLTHLAKAARHWPVYFFVDGEESKLARQMILDSTIQNHHIVIRGSNLGIGLNLISLRMHLFDEKRFDFVFVCESDVLVSPDIIPLLGNVLDWSKRELAWPAVSSSSVSRYSNDPKAVLSHLASWTNYLMPREAWEMIKPPLLEYEKMISGVPYKQRDDAAIQAWIERVFGMKDQGTTQDNINRILCYKLGIAVWSLARNRASHIGEFGEHCTPKVHASIQLSKQEMFPCDSDCDARDFLRISLESRPWIAKDAIEFLDLKLSTDKPTLFEWGAGNSTKWYAARCEKVVSVEHNEDWFIRVNQEKEKNSEISFIPLGPMYWNAIAGFAPDFVVIDGRHRKRCAEAVSRLPNKPAAILWDDAQREWYQCSMGLFDDYKRIDFRCVENKDRITRILVHPEGKFKHWIHQCNTPE